MEKNHRFVCTESGKIVVNVMDKDGRMGIVALNPNKIGNYSYQFVCPLCGRSVDARKGKDGNFRIVSHIISKGYMGNVYGNSPDSLRIMGTRKGKEIPAQNQDVA